jgi:hypothetical protein
MNFGLQVAENRPQMRARFVTCRFGGGREVGPVSRPGSLATSLFAEDVRVDGSL